MADMPMPVMQPKAENFIKRIAKGDHGVGLLNSLLLVAARIGSNLLALVWTMLLVRLVQPEASGAVFQAIAVAQIASILLTFNVESASMRFLVPALHDGRRAEAAGFIRFNRLTIPLMLPPVALGIALVQQGGAGMIAAVIVAMAATAMARATGRHATALGAMRQGLLPRLLAGPVVLSLGLGLAWAAGLALQAWHVVALFALSELAAALIQQWLLRGVFAPLAGPGARTRNRRQWVGQGLWMTPGLIMSEYRKSLLIAMAALVLAGDDLSRFTVAFSIINILNFGVVAVDVAFSQPIARAMVAGQPRRRDRLLASSAAIKLGGLGLGVALVLLAGEMALGWFGPDYAPALPAMLVLLLLPVSAVLAGPGAVLLTSAGRGREDFLGNVIGGAVTVAAICGLGALGGLEGAAAGAVIGYAAAQAIMAWFCRARLQIDPSILTIRHLFARPAAAGGAS